MSITVEEVVESLPWVLEQKPEVKYRVYAILEEHFPPREETNRILEEIRISREESNKRFEEMRIDMDKRFRRVDKRFDKVYKRFDEQKQDIKDHKKFMQQMVGGFVNRAGDNLEKTVAGTLRYALNRTDIKPDSLKLNRKIKDTKGMLGKKGEKHEYDLLATNGDFIIFEIKSFPDAGSVYLFARKCDLVIDELNLDENKVEKVIVALEKTKKVKDACAENNITLV